MLNLYTTLHTLAYTVGDRMKALKEDQRGASAVEYAILVGAIAAVLVVAVAAFGDKLKALFDNIDVSGTTKKS